MAEGLAPLMGWVKRLADHVIQHLMGEADLEFAWSDLRQIAPKEQGALGGRGRGDPPHGRPDLAS